MYRTGVKTVFLRAEILTKHLWSQGCYLCRLNSILNFGEFDDLDTDYWLFNCWLLIICYWLLLADYWLFIADYYCATCQNLIRVFFLQKGNLLVIFKKILFTILKQFLSKSELGTPFYRAQWKMYQNVFIYIMTMYRLWHYRLWSFKTGDTKLERFLHKNQHTQSKLLNFENWTNGEPQ